MGRSVLLFSAGLLGRLARWSLKGLAILLWWFFIRIARGAFFLALAGIGGLVAGIPQSTQLMADDWSRNIVEWGISPLTVDRLNPILRVWGFILIFMGWVVIGLVVGVIIIWAT
ncbi:hypothetical protein ACFLY4_10130 [Chloroflexota bacterium]